MLALVLIIVAIVTGGGTGSDVGGDEAPEPQSQSHPILIAGTRKTHTASTLTSLSVLFSD
jgi:hypothetical protein